MAPETMASAALPRPAERVAIVSLVLVFLCGVSVGAVAMSLDGHSLLHSARVAPSPPNSLSLSVAEWKKELDLTPDQTEKLTSILDDFSRYYDNVLADGNSRIMELLNPEQKLRFEQMLRDHKRP